MQAMMSLVGPACQHGEGEKRTVSVGVPGGPWAISWFRPECCPAAFSIFLIFPFSPFLFLFETFANKLQIGSNQIPKICKKSPYEYRHDGVWF
jgi:hypothetical protein